MESITVKCPCKINLTLEVTGVRDDGYHLLRSGMQTLDFFNIITVTLNNTNTINIASNCQDVPVNSTNTAYKAAALFIEKYNINKGVDIFIEKNVPFQAGLGSASADAAGVIYAMDKLYEGLASQNELQELGVSVGADVVFCLNGGTALAEGIGEVLTSLAPMPDCGILLVKPAIGASTPAIFKLYDSLISPQQPDSLKVVEAIKKANLFEISKNIGNVLEFCVGEQDIPQVKEKMLKTHCLGCAMTGSGTAVYALYSNVSDAEKASLMFDTKKYFVRVTRPYSGGVKQI